MEYVIVIFNNNDYLVRVFTYPVSPVLSLSEISTVFSAVTSIQFILF